jgi:DNA-binding CsgD family transcriptional regulator
MTAPNPIDVVEAAYRLDVDDRTWLTNVAKAVRPLIDDGRGLIAYYSDRRKAPGRWLDDAVTIDIPPIDLARAQEVLRTAGEMIQRVHFADQIPLGLASELPLDAAHPAVTTYRNGLARNGVFDQAAFNTVSPAIKGLTVVAAQVQPRRFDARTRRLWARVSAHVAAALRLRDALGEPDAVLTPSGRIEHAEGEARDAREVLRDAVLRQDKARGSMRRKDPEAATEAWTALVDGRWSLVDRFERGGRRYLVARRNELALPDPRALTPRERAVAHLAALGKSSKLIAYELGVSESSVASRLASAKRKLRATSRVELVRRLSEFRDVIEPT